MIQYLLIQVGFEGIDAILYLSDNSDLILQKREEAIEKEYEYHNSLFKDFDSSMLRTREEIAERFCIQKWDGESFDCCCKELKIKISQPIFY